MNIQLFKNAIKKEDLDSFLRKWNKQNIIDDCIVIKISPRDTWSNFLSYVRTHVDDSYHFSSIRSLILFKSNIDFSVEDISRFLIGIENSQCNIQYYSNKYWTKVFINGVSSFLIHKKKNSYLIAFPGAPAKPYSKDINNKHVLTPFLMSWPEYSESFLAEKDFVVSFTIQNLKKLFEFKNCLGSINTIDNIKEVNYRSLNDLNLGLEMYNSNNYVFSPEVHTFILKSNKNLFINVDKQNLFYSYKRTSNSLLDISVKKHDAIRYIYTMKSQSIKSYEECHKLANYIISQLPFLTGATSYCQIAFNDYSATDENTNISYGHITEKERIGYPKSNIYLYYNDNPIKIGIYHKKMFHIIINLDLKILYNDIIFTGSDILNTLTQLLLSYDN